MSYRSPGVYNKEIDASLYVQGAATSVAGMVGVTTKGPVGAATLVTSWPQFQEVFGSHRSDSYLPTAAEAFFNEGGSVLYVVRTAHYTDITDASTVTAVAASASVEDGALAEVLAVEALSPGTWANGYQVQIENVSTDLYNFLVLDADGDVVERFRSVVTNDETDSQFIERVVNGSSLFVTVSVTSTSLTPATAAVALSGGDDGLTSLADADYIGDAAGRNGLFAFDLVDTVKLIAVPGVASAAVHTALASYAESRGTIFAVLGSTVGQTPSQVLTYRATISGPYAGLYWPWVKVSDPITSMTTHVPPEGHVMGVIARSDSTAVWAAPAGLDRGRIRGALGVEYDTTQGERDELYDEAVNVIAAFKGKGTVIWGQKVLTSKPSALDRVNVRRLLNFIKESAKDTTKYLLFEPNDARTWAAFIRYMDPFLANIKTRRGLMDYHIVCDETTNTPYYIDRNQMVAKIFVKPTRTAEFIELQYIVTGSGADFSEL